MTKEAALHSFWSSFGLTAYEENSVPSDAELPYLTYETRTDERFGQAAIAVNVWYRTESWSIPNSKARQITDVIGGGGHIIPCDNGGIWIYLGSPAVTSLTDSDTTIKRKYINVICEYITSR